MHFPQQFNMLNNINYLQLQCYDPGVAYALHSTPLIINSVQ